MKRKPTKAEKDEQLLTHMPEKVISFLEKLKGIMEEYKQVTIEVEDNRLILCVWQEGKAKWAKYVFTRRMLTSYDIDELNLEKYKKLPKKAKEDKEHKVFHRNLEVTLHEIYKADSKRNNLDISYVKWLEDRVFRGSGYSHNVGLRIEGLTETSAEYEYYGTDEEKKLFFEELETHSKTKDELINNLKLLAMGQMVRFGEGTDRHGKWNYMVRQFIRKDCRTKEIRL